VNPGSGRGRCVRERAPRRTAAALTSRSRPPETVLAGRWTFRAPLIQVLTNCWTNAAKYTDTGGEIAWRGGGPTGGGAADVRDNGMGIAPIWLLRIFDLFQQGDRSGDGRAVDWGWAGAGKCW